MRRVFADARTQLHLLDRFWELPTMSISYDFRSAVKISSAVVITKPLPSVQHFGLQCAREGGKIRESLQPFFIIRQDRADLGLLKHELGDENRIWIAGSAPGEIAAVFAVPSEKCALKGSLFCHVERSRDISKCFRKQQEIPRLRSE